ncbi:hypothetical protein WN73_06950 [Bradyrhizobium sp. CCBAU 45394]|nr:hypothetical protein [Bradyrhizobium sp. CCBAU 45394]
MRLQHLILGVACLSLTGCGTYIPSQRDWPKSSSREVEDMNSALIRSIVCELSYAVTLTVKEDLAQARERANHRAYSRFLAGWGVEVATDLTVSENSTVNPTGLWEPVSPLSPVFTLGGGISGGAVATNENNFNVFYPIAALYKPTLFQRNSMERPCRDPSGNKEGSPLVDIDLKILPLLESRIQIVKLGLASDPNSVALIKDEKNVLTQTVSIKETVSGDITPSWKFTTGTVNPSGNLFSTGRERTHQIVFTFGPLAKGGGALTPLAQAFHINQQLKAGLRGTRITP